MCISRFKKKLCLLLFGCLVAGLFFAASTDRRQLMISSDGYLVLPSGQSLTIAPDEDQSISFLLSGSGTFSVDGITVPQVSSDGTLNHVAEGEANAFKVCDDPATCANGFLWYVHPTTGPVADARCNGEPCPKITAIPVGLDYTIAGVGGGLEIARFDEATSAATFSGAVNFCADAGGDDTYVCTLTPVLDRYVTGATYYMKVSTGNTTAASVDINGLGVKAIKRAVSAGVTTDPPTGDICANQVIELQYDGTNMQLQNPPCGALPVAAGGTGASTLTGVIKGNGTSAFTAATAGTDYSTPSSSETLSNKTINADGSNNVINISRRVWLPMAGCNNATAGSIWDLPTSGAATPACVTGTNTQKGVLDYVDAATSAAQMTYLLPETWTGDIPVRIQWFSATGSTNNVVWRLRASCTADGQTDDPSWSSGNTITSPGKATTNQLVFDGDTLSTGADLSTCAAGELLHIEMARLGGDGNDTFAGTARLIGVELVIQEAL